MQQILLELIWKKPQNIRDPFLQHYFKHIVIEILSKLKGQQIHNGGVITILWLLRVGEMDIL